MTTFTINGKRLFKAIKPMLALFPRKQTIPILNGIQVTVDDGAVKLVATDLEVSIIRTLGAQTEGSGTYVIANGRLFSQSLGNEDVTVRCDEPGKPATLKSGACVMSLETMSSESYPEIPSMPMDAPVAMLQADDLLGLISHTKYAISPEESRFTLNGALLDCVGVTAHMVTTDGHRLAEANTEMGFGSASIGKTLLPKLALETASKLFDGRDTVYIGRTEKDAKYGMVWFSAFNTVMVTRILSGNFPDWERVMPKDNGYSLVVDRKPLLDALQRAEKHANERSHTVMLTLNGCCKIAAKVDQSEYSECIPAMWDGPEDWQGAYSARYLVDMLKAHTGRTMTLKFKGPEANSQGIMSTQESSALDCYGDANVRAVVMPQRA